MIEPTTHGQETIGGMPAKGSAASAINPLATVISALAANGSSRILRRVFQLAWHSAAKRTAAKTNGSISPFQTHTTGRITGMTATLALLVPSQNCNKEKFRGML